MNIGRVVKRPKLKDTLAEGILSEGDVSVGLRVDEIARLAWRDLRECGDAG